MAGEAPQDSVRLTAAEPARRRSRRFAFACAVLASMTSILLGYDVGVMSGAAILIKEDLKISDTQVELLLGILILYSLLGSYAGGLTSDRIGRRLTVVFAGGLFFVGAVLMGFATSYLLLMAGRFVAGLGVGYALLIAPLYTAELAPASTRGLLTSLPEVFIKAGILLGYVSNYAFTCLHLSLGWRLMLGAGAFPSLLLAAGVLAIPNKPCRSRHDGLSRGCLDEASHVLCRTSDTAEEAELRLADIKDVAAAQRSSVAAVWKEFLLRPSPAVRGALLTAAGVHFFQQASGVDSVVVYSPRVLEKAGIAGKDELLLATVAVGLVKTVFVVVGAIVLDRVGRRPMLLGSAGGMVLASTGLGVGLTVVERSTGGRVPWAVGLSVASVLTYVACFSAGVGPVTWVYGSEVFPMRVRAQGASVGVAVNRATSAVVTMTFISLYKAIGIGGSFFLYGGVAAVAWLFFYYCVPETRGRTLEEMEEVFGTRRDDKGAGVVTEVRVWGMLKYEKTSVFFVNIAKAVVEGGKLVKKI